MSEIFRYACVNLKKKKAIGSGKFGDVYKGTMVSKKKNCRNKSPLGPFKISKKNELINDIVIKVPKFSETIRFLVSLNILLEIYKMRSFVFNL